MKFLLNTFINTIFYLFILYRICLKLDLKTKSYGQNKNRYIVISKKENSVDVFQELIENGYENDYYILIPPKKLIVH